LFAKKQRNWQACTQQKTCRQHEKNIYDYNMITIFLKYGGNSFAVKKVGIIKNRMKIQILWKI